MPLKFEQCRLPENCWWLHNKQVEQVRSCRITAPYTSSPFVVHQVADELFWWGKSRNSRPWRNFDASTFTGWRPHSLPFSSRSGAKRSFSAPPLANLVTQDKAPSYKPWITQKRTVVATLFQRERNRNFFATPWSRTIVQRQQFPFDLQGHFGQWQILHTFFWRFTQWEAKLLPRLLHLMFCTPYPPRDTTMSHRGRRLIQDFRATFA